MQVSGVFSDLWDAVPYMFFLCIILRTAKGSPYKFPVFFRPVGILFSGRRFVIRRAPDERPYRSFQ